MGRGIQVLSGKEKIELFPLGLDPSDELIRIFRLKLNHLAPSHLELFDFYSPSVALHLPDVFVWSGTRLYRQRLERDSTPESFDLESEVLAVYPLGKNWCLVCEILIEVRTHDLETILQKFDLSEIILEDWWEDGVLHLRDLSGRSFAFASRAGSADLLDQIHGDDIEVRV